MEATASAKYLRGSAQKARLVIDMIRGQDVNRALGILRYSSKRAAGGIEKCMRSAIANANETAEKANVSIDPDDLWIKAAFVDRGPTKNRRRVRPAPQGRAYRERRHFCHVTILLSSDARPEPGAKRKGGKDLKIAEARPAKLEESKRRKRGGAAAAPRAKRTGSKAAPAAKSGTDEKAGNEKKATKRASKKKTSAKEK